MRFALCDDDPLFADIAESLISRMGHEVVGVAHSPAAAVSLLEQAQPEMVVVDMAMGFGSDFDMVRTAMDLGMGTIVFSQRVDDSVLGHYDPRPEVVQKPDFDLLEACINRVIAARLALEEGHDRRVRPQRAAQGPVASSVGDAQAFYEALNNAEEGDVLVALDLPEAAGPEQAKAVGEHLTLLIRATDRLLASGSGVRLFLAGAGAEGRDALLGRLAAEDPPPAGTRTTSVVVADGEAGSDAFSRLKQDGTVHP